MLADEPQGTKPLASAERWRNSARWFTDNLDDFRREHANDKHWTFSEASFSEEARAVLREEGWRFLCDIPDPPKSPGQTLDACHKLLGDLNANHPQDVLGVVVALHTMWVGISR